MQATEFIWHNGKLVPWNEAKIHVLTHTLHYGGGAFEGIRTYKTEKGPAVFRLSEHIDRLFYSAESIKMAIPFSRTEVIAAVKETITLNKLDECYVRPIAFYGYGVMGVNPTGAPVELAIAVWPWGAYLPHDLVDIKTSHYIRIHRDSSVTDAKMCGHYINSMLARLEVQGTKYHEALMLDVDGNIAEGSGENFFIVKNGVIYTPKLGNILAGITRDTVMQIAYDLEYKVEEKNLILEDAYQADEAFFTGTAAEVTPIRSLDDKVIGDGAIGPVTQSIRKTYMDAVHGKDPRYVHYLTFVNEK